VLIADNFAFNFSAKFFHSLIFCCVLAAIQQVIKMRDGIAFQYSVEKYFSG
jgi:hypothetical protein